MADRIDKTRIGRVGGAPVYADDYDVTHNDILRELVDDLTEKAKEYEDSELPTEQGRKHGLAMAAGKLKARISDE